jgi:hypothetical protein
MTLVEQGMRDSRDEAETRGAGDSLAQGHLGPALLRARPDAALEEYLDRARTQAE